MRRMILAVAVLMVIEAGVEGQLPVTSDGVVTLSLTGDVVDTRPVNGYDGIVRTGVAERVTTVTGNVVVIINGVRITTDQAVWHSGSDAIDIGRNGAARIVLPGRVASLCVGRSGAQCGQ